jgi:hypothetical protein
VATDRVDRILLVAFDEEKCGCTRISRRNERQPYRAILTVVMPGLSRHPPRKQCRISVVEELMPGQARHDVLLDS